MIYIFTLSSNHIMNIVQGINKTPFEFENHFFFCKEHTTIKWSNGCLSVGNKLLDDFCTSIS